MKIEFFCTDQVPHCCPFIWWQAPIPVCQGSFPVLKYNGQTPVLANCLRCQLKFVTPAKMMADRYAAQEYLQKKYDEHRCAQNVRGLLRSERLKKKGPQPAAAASLPPLSSQ